MLRLTVAVVVPSALAAAEKLEASATATNGERSARSIVAGMHWCLTPLRIVQKRADVEDVAVTNDN